ncbi:MAG: hypothetical protein RLZZ385_816 [Pseudomonadota bacterium]|jgi:hypothetical protein
MGAAVQKRSSAGWPRCLLALVCFLSAGSVTAQGADPALPDNYAESVMILAMSDDASIEVSLRLARFPGTGQATVWLHIADSEGAWSLADESFQLDVEGATPVAEDAVSFSATRDAQAVRFDAGQRNAGPMIGRVTASLLASATRHPELVPGDVPISLDLEFEAGSAGYKDNGRWEMTGSVFGTITVGNHTAFTVADGKWHEQTGPRNRFAPAFRYFNVQNQDAAILAIQYADRFRGYALLPDGFHDLTAVSIDPPAIMPRRFSLTLDDGRIIEGTTRTVQEWSVPIEAQRRPGSSVVADSTIGQLTGSLNDWEPAP